MEGERVIYSHLSLSSQTRLKLETLHAKHASVAFDHVLIMFDISYLIGQHMLTPGQPYPTDG